MAESGVTIRNLAEFRRELRAIGPEWPRELRKTNKSIADLAAEASQAEASRMGGIWAKASAAIKGYANQRQASVGFPTGGKAIPFAGAAFWGTKRRTGWYGWRRYESSSSPQHPPWVGADWEAAQKGQGPYAINAALADHLDEILDQYADAIDDLASRAFDDR